MPTTIYKSTHQNKNTKVHSYFMCWRISENENYNARCKTEELLLFTSMAIKQKGVWISRPLATGFP